MVDLAGDGHNTLVIAGVSKRFWSPFEGLITDQGRAVLGIYYTDQFVLPLPEWHRFPMAKYAKLRERVAAAGLVPESSLRVPSAATDEQILRVHTPAYLDRVINGTLEPEEARALGFPWSLELVERSRRSSGATIAAARDVLDGEAFGVNLAGGTHHASPNHCAGYCVFNDVALAARTMQAEGRTNRVLIVDCDVHHGDGTALVFASDPRVFTFSIHGERNYPLRKPPSDLDVGLPDGTGDEAYLKALSDALPIALERARPDLVLYIAGADPFRADRFGRMNLTKEGLEERDRFVMMMCRNSGLSFVVSMAGGYSNNVDDIVDIHYTTVRLAVSGDF